ncbi:MAG: thiolase family protein [Caulobacterales bacterium]
MSDIFISPGLRTPFVKASGVFANWNALDLSKPIAKAMTEKARPDFVVWSQVIPDPVVSNIARELLYEAGIDTEIPAWSTILACASSFVGAVQAAGMLGKGGAHLALVGGVETMSHAPIALTQAKADALTAQFRKDPAGAAAALSQVTLMDFTLPVRGWTNKQSGRSQGEHTEDTAKFYGIAREHQDKRAFLSHQGAIKGQDTGFFKDLILPFDGVDHDTFPRRDTSLEKLASLPPAFDAVSGKGTLTAGNSSPLTDGAASLWVGDAEGLAKAGLAPEVKLIDWQIAAMHFSEEGILMAPARAIPQLLARRNLKFTDVALWEIHEAFAAQVLANVKAASDPDYRKRRAKVDSDLGEFPWERVNPNGGSLAIGHPFAATGARILSQAAAELRDYPKGARAIVSICADGGQGAVALLERA